MASRPHGHRNASRSPAPPRLTRPVAPAFLADHDIESESTFLGLAFDLDLPGRTAESVEFEECRFSGADLSDSALPRARFIDCTVDHTNLANLRGDRSTMLRVQVSASRMTGLHWLDGVLRDVAVSDCRADLSVFRSTTFQHVRFEKCNLARADFQNADLSGAEFVECDLAGAQFSHATMTGTRFRACDLSGIGGITSFRGAVFTGQDLVSLAYTFAAALGIELTEAAESTAA